MGGQPQEGGGGEGGGAAPSGRVIIPRSQVRLPLEVSTHLECRWRDGKFYPARIIERRKVEGEGGAEDMYEYYVHYRKCECEEACWLGVGVDCWRGWPGMVGCCCPAAAPHTSPHPLPPTRPVNRRMDEWVGLDNFNLDTVAPPEPADPADAGRTRGQKRKVDDDHR